MKEIESLPRRCTKPASSTRETYTIMGSSMIVLCVMTRTFRRSAPVAALGDGGVSRPGGRCLSPGRCPDAVGMMGSVSVPPGGRPVPG